MSIKLKLFKIFYSKENGKEQDERFDNSMNNLLNPIKEYTGKNYTNNTIIKIIKEEIIKRKFFSKSN